MFDRNMDGYIDMTELRKMFAMVGVGDGGVFTRGEMEEFMEEADRVSTISSVSYIKCQPSIFFVSSNFLLLSISSPESDMLDFF